MTNPKITMYLSQFLMAISKVFGLMFTSVIIASWILQLV